MAKGHRPIPVVALEAWEPGNFAVFDTVEERLIDFVNTV